MQDTSALRSNNRTTGWCEANGAAVAELCYLHCRSVRAPDELRGRPRLADILKCACTDTGANATPGEPVLSPEAGEDEYEGEDEDVSARQSPSRPDTALIAHSQQLKRRDQRPRPESSSAFLRSACFERYDGRARTRLSSKCNTSQQAC